MYSTAQLTPRAASPVIAKPQKKDEKNKREENGLKSPTLRKERERASREFPRYRNIRGTGRATENFRCAVVCVDRLYTNKS